VKTSRPARGSRRRAAIFELLDIMARLRGPGGCPWDRQQDHRSLRFHAVEEVYELLDAIEAGDDQLLLEELGDLLLQVIFHAQLAHERGAFDFEAVARHLADKLIGRHPHVFASAKVKSVEAVWAQWDKIKRAEKAGTPHERVSALDGIPKHLPALLRAEKLVKKARKAGLLAPQPPMDRYRTRRQLGRALFELVAEAQRRGWCAEDLLRAEVQRQEQALRRQEQRIAKTGSAAT
jgi:XTP/dITP diphosphohydrolase